MGVGKGSICGQQCGLPVTLPPARRAVQRWPLPKAAVSPAVGHAGRRRAVAVAVVGVVDEAAAPNLACVNPKAQDNAADDSNVKSHSQQISS